MKLQGTASLAVLLSGVLLLGACTSGEEPGTTTSESAGGSATESQDPCKQKVGTKETKDGQIKYTAGKPDWTGYNSITADTYSTYNNAIADRMLSGFTYYGTDGSICEDKDFGTVTVKSEDPLVVEYTISDKAVWSDGTPVTINDYLLDWAAQNPEFLAPGLVNGKDENAKPVFTHVSTKLAERVPEGPQGKVDAKTFTIQYDKPDPDFMINVTAALPAHVVAKKSGLEPKQLAQAILDKDAETVKKAAKFWNEGWIYNPGELPKDMSEVPSSGPYKLKANGWKAGTSLTLEANDKYWGEPAATKEMIFRFLDDAGQTQALENGDVQVISPQATVDTVPQLEALGESVKVYKYSLMTWEHLDFNVRKGSVMEDQKVREAFAMCVPRQNIVDKLVKPINPDGVVMNAREVFPFQKEKYEAVTSKSYDGRYDKVDVEGAKKKLEEAGVQTPVKVRIGYVSGNQRRQETVSMIQSVCKDAGFEVVDAASAKFFEKELPNGEYEVALFAWAGSGQVTSGENIYGTGKPQNYHEYSNKKVDDAYTTLSSTLDEKEQQEQITVIEKELWDTLHGIPLYAHPGVTGADAQLDNVRPTAVQAGVVWNADQWAARS